MDRNNDTSRKKKNQPGSLSARRAWIEIFFDAMQIVIVIVSLSARRAWIEMFCYCSFGISGVSLSARRAWIEIR